MLGQAEIRVVEGIVLELPLVEEPFLGVEPAVGDYRKDVPLLQFVADRYAQVARIQAEERKAAAERRLQELETQIRELGVDPENIEEEITRLDREINGKIARIEELLAPFEEMTGNARNAGVA